MKSKLEEIGSDRSIRRRRIKPLTEDKDVEAAPYDISQDLPNVDDLLRLGVDNDDSITVDDEPVARKLIKDEW
jgi:hypothetical protein